MPIFTVVTPSYQQGIFLERTITSVLSQGVDLEFIVMDGGSQDQTLEILAQYDNEIDWVSAPDGGQADAVNQGIAKAQGEIIAWLNSDDVYYPGALARVAQVFHQHPEAQVVYGDADWIDEFDQVLKPFPTEPWSYQRLKETCYLCQPAVFFRRSLAEQWGVLEASLNYCMDYELWLRYGQQVDFYYLPHKLAGSRMYSSNKTMGQALAAHAEINQMLQKKLDKIPANWLFGYALIKAEKTTQISRYDRRQTHHFVAHLVWFSLVELMHHNRTSLWWAMPKMVFWFLLPDRAWFRREDILALV